VFGGLLSKDFFKKLLTIICYLTLIHGLYWVFILFFGRYDLISGAVGMFVGQSTGFLIFIYIATTLLLLKLKASDRVDNPKKYFALMFTGFFIVAMFCMPLLLTPVSISHAEQEFADAFGENWEEKIPDDVKEKYFLKTPFSLTQYFLGVPHKDCKIERNILYHQEGDVKLYFDVYMPKKNDKDLPGNRSIIIRIHGGGWTIGDKSLEGMVVNKYLAAQGYVIFDIQYGLREDINFENMIKFKYQGDIFTPKNVLGDFTVEDQIRHIGIFTKKLEEKYAAEYDANIKSVYIMGDSAGGHLTSVFGFGYNDRHGKYAEFFNNTYSDNLVIKGLVPIYPAVDAKLYFDKYMPDLLDGDPKSNPDLFEAYTPSNLIDKNDPPALIFQGTSDGLAPMEQSAMLEEAMDDNNVPCVRLLFPLAGHANDVFYNSNYGQVYLYYLERFLYLTQ